MTQLFFLEHFYALQIPKKTVETKIEKLYLADLVYRSAAKYYTFNDICLMRFIKFVYEQDLKGTCQLLAEIL
ncbi:hypothetical protein MHK_002991 [Candidatus Magnetomorum sp. HK-1]|nr:hypothetical protein MHK_002991 [Candidatus Magnetomorum sp. HK-1]